MSNLVAVAYPDESTASEVAQTLIELQKEHSIQLEDLVVAIRKDDGKIKLKQSFSPAGSGAAGGALWGGLIGLIFFMPLLGMAIGGATGAAAGAATDVGVDDKFMKELGEKLQPGGAAVFVLVSQSTPDKVLPRISQYGGEVIHSSLSEHAEETLQEALRAAHDGLARRSADQPARSIVARDDGWSALFSTAFRQSSNGMVLLDAAAPPGRRQRRLSQAPGLHPRGGHRHAGVRVRRRRPAELSPRSGTPRWRPAGSPGRRTWCARTAPGSRSSGARASRS